MSSNQKMYNILLVVCFALTVPTTVQAKIDKIHATAARVFQESEDRSNEARGRPTSGGSGSGHSSRSQGAWRHCPVNSACWKEMMKHIDETAQKHLGPNSRAMQYQIPKEAR